MSSRARCADGLGAGPPGGSRAVAAWSQPDLARGDWRARPAENAPGARRDGPEAGTRPTTGHSPAPRAACLHAWGERAAARDRGWDARPCSARSGDGARPGRSRAAEAPRQGEEPAWGPPLAPRSAPPPEAGDPRCGARLATTDRLRISSGGRMPRLAVGTKLAGVAVICGPVWIGWRLFTSTWTTRAGRMGPWPKRFSLTALPRPQPAGHGNGRELGSSRPFQSAKELMRAKTGTGAPPGQESLGKASRAPPTKAPTPPPPVAADAFVQFPPFRQLIRCELGSDGELGLEVLVEHLVLKLLHLARRRLNGS